jgi:hypothetical protein
MRAGTAIVITRRSLGRAVYGVVWFSARTTLDQDKRIVTLYELDVTKTALPSAGSEESSHAMSTTHAMTQWNLTIALDRLLADLLITVNEETARQNFSCRRDAVLAAADVDGYLRGRKSRAWTGWNYPTGEPGNEEPPRLSALFLGAGFPPRRAQDRRSRSM